MKTDMDTPKSTGPAAVADQVDPVVMNDVRLFLPSIGTGIERTSATYAALFIQLEGRRSDQIDVLDSVMESLGIHPDEVLHHRKMPDCGDEAEFDAWEEEAERLEQLHSS